MFTLTVFVCPHDYATVVIMFYSFCFNKVPSKTFRMAFGDSCVDPAGNQKLWLLVLLIHRNVLLI